MIPLAIAFIVLDLTALAMLGPLSLADTMADVTTLYGDRSGAVLVSRLLHGFGLVAGAGFLGLLVGRLRAAEGGTGTLTRIAYGGFVAVLPIEITRNVIMTVLALRITDFGESALALHLVAVVLGPAIAFPVIASLAAIAVLRRSPLVGAVSAIWSLSTVRLLTTSTTVWYAGFVAFPALLAVLVVLAVQLRDRASAMPAQ